MSESEIALPEADAGRRTEAAVVLGACFLPLIAAAIYVLVRGARVTTYDTLRVTIGIVFESLVAIGVLSFLAWRGFSLKPFRMRLRWASLMIGAFIGLLMIGTSAMVYSSVLRIVPRAGAIGVSDVRDSAPLALMLAFILYNSFFEEAFVLAYPVAAFENAGAASLIVGSAALRASYHAYQGPAGAAAIFVLGVILASVYWRSRDLTIPFVAHTVMNVIVMTASR
jgi:membrane protease YdiL (CAAX protease family)